MGESTPSPMKIPFPIVGDHPLLLGLIPDTHGKIHMKGSAYAT
jgi:hypothetical protein